MSFIKNPSDVFWQAVRASITDRGDYGLGRLSMALEVVTLIRSLEALPVVTDLGRSEAISALHTMLVEQQMDEMAYEWYERLAEWRKPKLRAEHGHVQQGTDDVGDLPYQPRQLCFDLSSEHASPEEVRTLPATVLEGQLVRRSLGASPTSD